MNEEMTVYENRGGEVWERHPDGRRELFAEDIIRKLTTQERELAAVTEQRDRLAEAIRKHKDTLYFTPDYSDEELYEALQSLNQPTP